MKKCSGSRTTVVLMTIAVLFGTATAYLGWQYLQLKDEVAVTRRRGEAAFARLYKCAVAEAKTCRVVSGGPEILRDFLPDQATLGPTEFAFLMENWSGKVGDGVRTYLHALEEPVTFDTAFLEEASHE
jgi:hypothetical protein